MKLIAVHAGAGDFTETGRVNSLAACRKAVRQCVAEARLESGAVECCVAAVECLENDPETNAGLGSNLTMVETVECDASVMDGASGAFGGAGMVSSLRNPVRVAQMVLTISQGDDCSICGLVPPLTLMGAEVEKLYLLSVSDNAKAHRNLACNSLITEKRRKEFRILRKLLDERKAGRPKPYSAPCPPTVQSRPPSDTVGAVVLLRDGGCAAGSSSGGNVLKLPGRLGPACQFGTCCFAKSIAKPSTNISIAISTSGSGESITRTRLAQSMCSEIVDAYSGRSAGVDDEDVEALLLPQIVARAFETAFLESDWADGKGRIEIGPMSGDDNSSVAGMIVGFCDHGSGLTELIWVHNSPEFIVGYYDHRSSKCKAFISKLSHGDRFLVSSKPIHNGSRASKMRE